MSRSKILTATLVGAIVCLAVPHLQAATKGAKPQDSPGWVVIDEDWFVPLRFDSAEALHDARVHYRQNEEKAAANELRRAESWVKFAAGHALPETQKSLNDAAQELEKVAYDIDHGQLQDAASLSRAVAKTSQALAEWHYFKAKEHLGQSEESWAAMDLQAAARHLQLAADSAQYEYGSDTVDVFDDVDNYGHLLDEGVAIDRNSLADNLTVIEREIKKLKDSLKKGATS